MRKIILVIIILTVLFGAILFSIRFFNEREVDDVHPDFLCSDSLLRKSEILWVIPLFNNHSIAENPAWCSLILSYNKTLGLHGVYHTFEEFRYKKEADYLNEGIYAFEECFGYKPRLFKPPQLAISKENKETIRNLGFVVEGRFNQMTHKIYHCSDTGEFPNWLVDFL